MNHLIRRGTKIATVRFKQHECPSFQGEVPIVAVQREIVVVRFQKKKNGDFVYRAFFDSLLPDDDTRRKFRAPEFYSWRIESASKSQSTADGERSKRHSIWYNGRDYGVIQCSSCVPSPGLYLIDPQSSVVCKKWQTFLLQQTLSQPYSFNALKPLFDGLLSVQATMRQRGRVDRHCCDIARADLLRMVLNWKLPAVLVNLVVSYVRLTKAVTWHSILRLGEHCGDDDLYPPACFRFDCYHYMRAQMKILYD